MPRKKVKAVEPFKPKSYKELVEWFVLQINSGVATKRDFVQLAAGLKVALPKKAISAKKPAGKATLVDELKDVNKQAKKPAKKK